MRQLTELFGPRRKLIPLCSGAVAALEDLAHVLVLPEAMAIAALEEGGAAGVSQATSQLQVRSLLSTLAMPLLALEFVRERAIAPTPNPPPPPRRLSSASTASCAARSAAVRAERGSLAIL